MKKLADVAVWAAAAVFTAMLILDFAWTIDNRVKVNDFEHKVDSISKQTLRMDSNQIAIYNFIRNQINFNRQVNDTLNLIEQPDSVRQN